MTQIAIFTDLDGTLLDHGTYSHAPARPALDALRARGIPLVLASSKTAAEIARLHRALGLGAVPAIVENGAGLYDPTRPQGGSDQDYHRLRAALAALPAGLRAGFRGFGDMTPGQIAELTGLPPDAARDAARRQFSEPGLWSGSASERDRFLAALAEQGISARSGGRFLTLSQGATKADRLGQVARHLGASVTIALGDAPNDRELLEAADYGVIIRNDHGPGLPELPGEATGRILRSTQPGPIGWNSSVLSLLARLSDPEQQK